MSQDTSSPRFIRVEGPGRCDTCCWDIDTQGHHPQCPDPRRPIIPQYRPRDPLLRPMPWDMDDPKPVRRQHRKPILPANSSVLTSYVAAALSEECNAVRTNTGRGDRNHVLNRAAFSLGTLVGAGVLSEAVAKRELYQAATDSGYVNDDGPAETKGTICSGIDSGKAKPRNMRKVGE